MENNIENQGGLSASHLKELEVVIGQILTNQEIIMQQNKDAIASKKNDRIWGIIKAVIIWVVLPMIAMAYMPQLIAKMTGQISGAMGDKMKNVVQKDSGTIDVEKAAELMQLLGQ